MKAVSFQSYKEYLSYYRIFHPEIAGVIFSGGEVTLNNHLIKFAEYTRRKKIRHIMIQTNGRKLSTFKYVKDLVAAGVNEFFVSIHTYQENINKKITRKKSSFNQTINGIENLNKLNIKIITNTVITSLNYLHLPQIANFLSCFNKIETIQFSGYLPMHAYDKDNLLIPYNSILPYLEKAVKISIMNNKQVILKYFPECLLSISKQYLDNSQPVKVIGTDNLFWDRFKRCNFSRCTSCTYQKCAGLPLAYRIKYGDICGQKYPLTV